jgi:hypothetical protein
MGRTLDNALLNLGLKDGYSVGIDKLGFNMENILDKGNVSMSFMLTFGAQSVQSATQRSGMVASAVSLLAILILALPRNFPSGAMACVTNTVFSSNSYRPRVNNLKHPILGSKHRIHGSCRGLMSRTRCDFMDMRIAQSMVV